MKTVICCGDSNTWGYDPRGWLEDRYAPEDRWCDRLAEKTGFRVLNLGENGRCIPRHPSEYRIPARAIEEAGEGCQLILLLGTNDLLQGFSPEDTAEAMDALLDQLRRDFPALSPVLLSPPPIRIPAFSEAAAALTRYYEGLSRQYGLPFLDLQGLPLAFDGVHLSPEGHRLLGDLLAALLGGPGK